MSLNHGDLVKCCLQVLDGFDSESYAVENRISEFLESRKDLNLCEQTFIKEVLSGCVRYAPILKVVLRGFYNSDGKFALIADQDLYRVFAYLVLFRLDELGLDHIKKFVHSQKLRKVHTFLNFMLNEKNLITWMKDEWCKLYDPEFVMFSLLHPLQEYLPDLHEFLDTVKAKIDNSTPGKKVVLPGTVPEPFDMTPSKPKKVPMPAQIPMLDKHKPVPSTTYDPPKCTEVLTKIKEENKKKSLDRYEWIKNNSLHVSKTEKSPKTLQRMQEIVDVENSKLCFEGCIGVKPIPPAVLDENIPIKLNAAAIMREERLYKKREEEELKKLERLEAGEGDSSEFVEWQARMRKLDRERQLEEIEQRRLSGLLSQEEAVIARQKLILINREIAAEMKAEAEHLMKEYMQQRLVEEERLRKLMEKVMDTHESAKEAKKQLQAYKAKIVQSMNEEMRELMQQALEEAAVEMQQKIDLIHQIRAMESTVAAKQPKFIDFTETAGYGLLCEMSIAELRERLGIMEVAQQEEEMLKREQIITDKQSKTQMLLDKLDTIAKHRNELSRVAAVRAEERRKMKEVKVRPPHPRSDVILVMEKTLEDRKAERRRLEEETRLGQDQHRSPLQAKTHQQQQTVSAKKQKPQDSCLVELQRNRSDSKVATLSVAPTAVKPAATTVKSRTALLAM